MDKLDQSSPAFIKNQNNNNNDFNNNINKLIDDDFDLYDRLTPDYYDNALDFHQLNNESFPILSLLARVFLSFPVTVVPCEALFSHCGLIVTELRSRLSKNNVEQLAFIKRNYDNV